MKICIPILEPRGLLSPISPDLAAAPSLLLVEMGTLAYRAIPNLRRGGAAAPGGAAPDAREAADVFIVSALDRSAVTELSHGGTVVYAARGDRVADALADLIAGRLPVLPPRRAVGAGT